MDRGGSIENIANRMALAPYPKVTMPSTKVSVFTKQTVASAATTPYDKNKAEL